LRAGSERKAKLASLFFNALRLTARLRSALKHFLIATFFNSKVKTVRSFSATLARLLFCLGKTINSNFVGRASRVKLTMKIILITGASEGIGAELARQLAAKLGANGALVLAARNMEALQAVAKDCAAHGAKTLCVRTDVGIRSDCERLIQSAVNTFAGVDVLINNAGISAQALLQEVPADKLGWYEDVMRINHWGSVWCTHAALPYLLKSKGSIVAVSSLAGLVGVPGRTAYSASKFAMAGFFEALRTELKSQGVSVTLAYPGVVLTQIRQHGLNAQGAALGSSGLKEAGAMTVQTCARLIIHGMEKRQREVVMSFKGKLGRWLKLIAPSWVEKLAIQAVKAEFLAVKPKD
jgi:short-subunit dehydrogenase